MIQILRIIVLINGVYDIVCAICILLCIGCQATVPVFSKLHPTMFLERSDDPVVNRLLSYWILTYGIVRLYAGLVDDYHIQILAAMTYFIEAGCFSYENLVGMTLVDYKANFVSITSVILGSFLLMNTYRK